MPERKPLLSPEQQAFLKGDLAPVVSLPTTTPAPAAATAPPPTAVSSAPEATVRFTVDLPRSMHKQLKQAALNRDLPMTDLARQALAEWLASNS